MLAENPALPVKIGDPLDSETLRESLRVLYRSGLYADLRAESSLLPEGLRLDFVVKQNYFINLVRIQGLQEPPAEGVALASLRLTPGEAFQPSNLDAALSRLRDTLREDGLYQAGIAAIPSPNPETLQMDILIQVEPGPRVRLGKVAIRNHTEFQDDQLADRSHLKPGLQVTSARLKKSADRIRNFLVKKNHLSARVAVHRGEYDSAANLLPLDLDVSAGPVVRVDIKGSRIPRRDLRKLLPIYAEGAVDDDLLEEGRRAIAERLESEGYFDADVQFDTSEVPSKETPKGITPSVLLITYKVERGVRHRLNGIAIEGNRYFSDALLRGRLQIQPSSFSSRARFSKKLAQSDAGAMRDLYVANGFREAQVTAVPVDDYKGKSGTFLCDSLFKKDRKRAFPRLKSTAIRP